jgi:acetylornithine/N-succinyldiaminopimelate aminotransferase
MTNATHPFDALMEITARPQTVFVRGRLVAVGRHRQALSRFCAGMGGELPWPFTGDRGGGANQAGQAAAHTEPGLLQRKKLETGRSAGRTKLLRPGVLRQLRRGGQRGCDQAGAHEIITFEGAFHGRTLATMSASGKKAFEGLFEPKVSGFPKAQLNDLASVGRLVNDKAVAVMLEPIQGEAGVWPATDQFLRDLRELTDAHGLLLILDEIQTGFSRTGKLYHYEHADITPDIMTLGKGIGGGVPLAALLSRQGVSCLEHGDQGGTFCGNPLMCAGLAVLKHVSAPAFLKSVTDSGLYLESKLQRLSARHGLGEVRGRGLLLALDLKMPMAASIVAQAFEHGVLLNAPTLDALRFMPALNVTRQEIDIMTDYLDAVLTKMGAARSTPATRGAEP